MTSADVRRVHLMDGLAPSGRRVRAVCSCGHATTPRADEDRALAALTAEHELTRPQCALCGHDYTGRSWQQLARADLRILTDSTGDQFLVCRDMPRSCADGAAQRQVHLDRAAFEGFGLPVPPPTLRVIPGGQP